MALKDKKFLVAGAGKSGIGSVNLLLKAGADVVLTDENKDLDQDALYQKIYQETKIPLILGEVTAGTEPGDFRECSNRPSVFRAGQTGME